MMVWETVWPKVLMRSYPNGMCLYLLEKFGEYPKLNSRRWDTYILYDSRGRQIFARTIDFGVAQ